MVLAGLAKLAGRSPWCTAAAFAAAWGVLLGIPLLVVEPGWVLTTVETIVLGVVVFGTLTAVREVIEDSRARATANLLRWTYLTLTLVALLAIVLVEPTEVTGANALFVAVAALVAITVFVWILVFLWSNRADPVLGSPSSRRQPDPAR